MRCGFAVRFYVLYSGKTTDRDNVWIQTAGGGGEGEGAKKLLINLSLVYYGMKFRSTTCNFNLNSP